MKVRGAGLVNDILNKLPLELHLPGYQYCGPGTKLQERLKRGDPGVNPLDAACKEHDIAYSKNRQNVGMRNTADKVLADRAWQRVFARDAKPGERLAAWGVTNVMKAKAKLGMGVGPKKMKKKKKKETKLRRTIALRKIIDAAKKSMKPSPNVKNIILSSLQGARASVKSAGGRKYIHHPRVLPVPKLGGVLPFLIPLFAGLSAVGALTGGAAGIAKAINDAKVAKHRLDESQRHNQMMEAIALGGKGLYLKPYKHGLGLYLSPKNL